MRRVVVLGIDGLNPDLLKFWMEDLKNIKEMQQSGVLGSIVSPVPSSPPYEWISFQCGKNPGAFGIWGEYYRDDFSYSLEKLVDSRIVDKRVRCLYRILPTLGQKVAMINVPASWPPPKIPAGFCISNINEIIDGCFTWPKDLTDELSGLINDCISSVKAVTRKYHELDMEDAQKRIYEMDCRFFSLVKHFISEKKCDYVLAFINGIELMSHLFLRDFDINHCCFRKDSSHKDVLLDYYQKIDSSIGEIKNMLDEDTVLIIYSTHSVKRLHGRFNLNEWLIQNGYLVLHDYPEKPVFLRDHNVDWSKSRCWAIGSSGQIYINLKGREPEGVVEAGDYDNILERLSEDLKGISDDRGNVLKNKVVRRDEVFFGEFVDYGPDLFVSIDEGRWSVNNMVGYRNSCLFLNDETGASSGKGYDPCGYFCIAGSDFPSAGEMKGISNLNIAPTIIDIMNLRAPYTLMQYEMEGQSILEILRDTGMPTTSEKEKAVRSRLEALGY